MTSLTNIPRSSLRQEAARVIRAGIISGEIAPGKIHSVPTLSSQLGVSATPVREAMLDLASEGLVVGLRNKGFRVVTLGVQDLEDILRLRLLLEVPSMGDVAESHREKEIAAFRTIGETLPNHVAAGDIHAYLDADRAFHLGLLGLLGNNRLVDIVGLLRNQMRLSVARLGTLGQLMDSARQHVDIFEAIANRDRSLTEALMTDHLECLRLTWADQELASNTTA